MLQSTPKNLYSDQERAIELLREAAKETRRIVMQAPTGFGKTLLAATLTESALKKNKRVLFTVPAISLIDQTVRMFWDQGIRDVGVIQQDHAMTDWTQPVQIASVQTLYRRAPVYDLDSPEPLPGGQFRTKAVRDFPKADVILVDEVHRWFKGYYPYLVQEKTLEKIPIIGLSATPWTKGLGMYFDKLVIASTTAELIANGRLSPFKVFAPEVHPDLEGVRSHQTKNGLDYVEEELEERMVRAELVADIVDTWLYRAEERPTLCFAVNRAHARVLTERFKQSGVAAEYQDANTRMPERESIRRRFHSGETKVVVNIGTLTTGVDWDVRCISMCRPTRSEILFVQIIGRGLRTAPGKDHCLILDHSDNHLRLGFVTEIDAYHQGLHSGQSDIPAGRDTNRIALPKECPNCGFIKAPRLVQCPNCGTRTEAHAQTDITEEDGELVEFDRKKLKRPAVSGDKADVYAGLLWIAKSKGYKPGWISHKYREIFGVWPVGLKFTPPKRPDCDLEEFIRRENIKFARRKRRQEVANGNGDAKPADRAERDEAIIRRVREDFGKLPAAGSTLMTEEDEREDWK